MSEEALQIAVKRREVNGKGERERYSHLNAELQRIARRDKKAFLSDQCKFHAKMVSIKDRNGTDLTKAEDIKKILRRAGKNTQKNYTKKIFMT